MQNICISEKFCLPLLPDIKSDSAVAVSYPTDRTVCIQIFKMCCTFIVFAEKKIYFIYRLPLFDNISIISKYEIEVIII